MLRVNNLNMIIIEWIISAVTSKHDTLVCQQLDICYSSHADKHVFHRHSLETLDPGHGFGGVGGVGGVSGVSGVIVRACVVAVHVLNGSCLKGLSNQPSQNVGIPEQL